MRRLVYLLLILLGAGVLAAAAVLISFATLLNGSGLRTRVEEALSHSTGRSVTIARLQLSPWTGSAIAEDLRIADDAQFSATRLDGTQSDATPSDATQSGDEPFVRAARVRIGIEILPLLLRRQVRIGSIALEEPAIRLLRNTAGIWNFASLRRPQPPATDARATPRTLPDLAITSFAVEDGHLLVRIDPAPSATSEPARELRFDRVQFGVRHFDLSRAFPFDLSSALPAGGTLALNGTAGPWNQANAAATPASAHIHLRQLDLQAAGLVAPTALSGVAGQFADIAFDLAWRDAGLHVSKLVLESPRLTVGGKRRTAPSSADAAPQKPSAWSSVLEKLSVADATVAHGTCTLLRDTGRPAVFTDLNLHLTDWSAARWAAFNLSALYGASAPVTVAGRFRIPTNVPGLSTREAEVDAHVTVSHLDLAGSGLLTPGSPFSALLDAEAQVQSASGTFAAGGSARLDRLRLARGGTAYGRSVLVRFSLAQHSAEAGIAGVLDHATVTLGTGAVVNVAGSYHLGGPVAIVDLRTSATALPIDQIEAFLPTVGMQLPAGSRLTGGTVTTALSVNGPTTSLAISGPVRVENTRLMGFDLGSKLASLARFTGGRLGSAASPGTSIRSLTLDLRSAGGAVATDRITADIAGIGVATGSGTISPGARLDYSLALKLNELIPGTGGGAGLARDLAGMLPGKWAARALGAIDLLAAGPMKNGIPILIGGTAAHPVVTPSLAALLPADRPRR